MLSTYGIKLFFSSFLESFLQEKICLGIRKGKTQAIIGWGYKKKTEYPRKIAKKYNIPYWALEDGFYRSLDLGVKGSIPYSIILDKTGIYYNAQQESDLENYLNEGSFLSEDDLLRVNDAISFIIKNNLSKYNQSIDIDETYFSDSLNKEKILIVDQTYNDASVLLSGVNENAFDQMVNDALSYPHTQVFIKIHPDVICGKKKGYLKKYLDNSNIKFIVDEVSSLSLLKQMDKVFVVSSQMGFEALLLGKEVHCYGMPFYAGWGLTIDKIQSVRRKQKHSIQSLFYAACIKYPYYVNPFTKKKCELEEILRILAIQKQCNNANRGIFVCVGFSYWKYPHARAYLQSTDNKIYFCRDKNKGLILAKEKNAKIVAWSSKITDEFAHECQKNNITIIRMEDGFLRSVGLGSDFNWPFSLVLDQKGIYYNPLSASDLEYILENFNKRDDQEFLIKQAQKLQNLIISKGLSKYNVGNNQSLKKEDFTNNKRLLLVPGQVEDDASVKYGGGEIKSNLDLLIKVRALNSDACIIYKPHPDVEKLNRKGKIDEKQALLYADYVCTNVNIVKLLEIVDEVHTLTSLTGFEALLREIKVFCYGMPFYAGWGLTNDYQICVRRTSYLKLEELIAGTLILYPRYYEWTNSCFSDAFDICSSLLNTNGKQKSPKWARLFNSIREFIRAGFK